MVKYFCQGFLHLCICLAGKNYMQRCWNINCNSSLHVFVTVTCACVIWIAFDIKIDEITSSRNRPISGFATLWYIIFVGKYLQLPLPMTCCVYDCHLKLCILCVCKNAFWNVCILHQKLLCHICCVQPIMLIKIREW